VSFPLKKESSGALITLQNGIIQIMTRSFFWTIISLPTSNISWKSRHGVLRRILNFNSTKVWIFRKLDEEIALRLLEMPKHSMVNFAWDHIEDEVIVKEKIELLKSVGFTKSQLRMHVQFYVYVDSDAEYQSGVYRCREPKNQV
jgi:hypothetical protein